jgi:transcriptional regulator with XRE-family HTH domain
MKITSEMVRAARAFAHWSQADLATRAGVSLPTIKRIEKEPGPIPGRVQTAEAIEAAFAKLGIEFLFDRGQGVLRKRY